MDRKYAEEYEDKGFSLLEELNNDILRLQDLGRCPKAHTTDASGHSVVGEVNIEIKCRDMTLLEDLSTITACTKDGRTYSADTIFIETHKCGDMLLDYVCEGKIPLYVNFLNEYCIVYNLSRLKHRPKKVQRRIYSTLYDGFELSKRQELRVSDAYIYKKGNDGYKLVRRPSDE